MRPLLPAGLATGLLAATLLAAPTAQAAGETCHGQPATIVGSYLQRDLVGTGGSRRGGDQRRRPDRHPRAATTWCA